jgi:hypothetical protein
MPPLDTSATRRYGDDPMKRATETHPQRDPDVDFTRNDLCLFPEVTPQSWGVGVVLMAQNDEDLPEGRPV